MNYKVFTYPPVMLWLPAIFVFLCKIYFWRTQGDAWLSGNQEQLADNPGNRGALKKLLNVLVYLSDALSENLKSLEKQSKMLLSYLKSDEKINIHWISGLCTQIEVQDMLSFVHRLQRVRKTQPAPSKVKKNWCVFPLLAGKHLLRL